MSQDTKYRLLQYKDRFARDSVSMELEIAKSFKNFKEIPNYDLVILQKTILSTNKVKKIAQLSKKFIYDADDRIWLRPLKKYSLLTRSVSIIDCEQFANMPSNVLFQMM